MKKVTLIISIVCMSILLIACKNAGKSTVTGEVQSISGYAKIEENTLYFDQVEIVTSEDTERIEELSLDEQADYPSGYCIINEKSECQTFTITDETEYEFVDFELDFVKDEEGDRLYTTKQKDEFLKHLGKRNDMELEKQQIPLIIEVQDGKVIRITEKFEYTI